VKPSGISEDVPSTGRGTARDLSHVSSEQKAGGGGRKKSARFQWALEFRFDDQGCGESVSLARQGAGCQVRQNGDIDMNPALGILRNRYGLCAELRGWGQRRWVLSQNEFNFPTARELY
jgi:hypothetical protein